MSFTKQHFEAVAAVIRQAGSTGNAAGSFEWRASREATRMQIAADLAEEFAKSNPRLDRKRFIAACL